ncbi:alpha/beta family hydrolase [Usitatibacter palustris]|uniref:KANL3/Tex30 alpha/beta hydrolase-like domain-containing protein n=1 Tax=Usitatibacter palustris TaxID=2732487 RepID=A0A6M4H644_9PROT|nr:alpha/beta family hydrolase [Usitatibacter palustris]QJR15121.1 hypothetical protein DSM104440_01938 [Usitatibacter palustris]
MTPTKLRIVTGEERVSGLLTSPPKPQAALVLAHGAGAGMVHPFMVKVADGLATRGVATVRYQFPYMEKGSKRPDTPRIAQATVRAAVDEAVQRLGDVPLFAGGKSFGGRMTSQAQSAQPLRLVRGLVFLGFPLHAAGQPSDDRGKHLLDVKVPMLFLQGTRDSLADLTLMKPLVKKLGARAALETFDHADHSFHVPAKSGRNDAEVMEALLDAMAAWMTAQR